MVTLFPYHGIGADSGFGVYVKQNKGIRSTINRDTFWLRRLLIKIWLRVMFALKQQPHQMKSGTDIKINRIHNSPQKTHQPNY